MIPHLLLWSIAVCAILFSLTAIIWTIYAAYNGNKIEIQPNNNNNISRPNESGILLSGNATHLPAYESNKMDSRIDQFLHMQYIYSIDSDTDTCCTSDEELTDLPNQAVDVAEKISPTPPTSE